MSYVRRRLEKRFKDAQFRREWDDLKTKGDEQMAKKHEGTFGVVGIDGEDKAVLEQASIALRIGQDGNYDVIKDRHGELMFDKYASVTLLCGHFKRVATFDIDGVCLYRNFEVPSITQERLEDAVSKAYKSGWEDGRDYVLSDPEFFGFEAGYEYAKMHAEKAKNPRKPAKLTRKEIVKQAQADVAELRREMTSADVHKYGNATFKYYPTEVEFAINREKYAVTALVKGALTGNLYEVGVAKTAPGDCFNEDIGKAIALRRALGLDVPAEYLNAPQPEGKRVGDVISFPKHDRWHRKLNYRVDSVESKQEGNLTIVYDDVDPDDRGVGIKAWADFEEKDSIFLPVIDDSAREEYK